MRQSAIERICDLLYEAAVAADAWPKALAALAESVGAVNAHFAVWNKNEQRTEFFAGAQRDSGWEALYAKYYGSIAPCRRLLDDRRMGEWVASHRYFDQAFVCRNEYFNDFLLRIGGLYSIKSRIFEPEAGGVYAIAGLLRSPKTGPFEDAEVEQIATTLNGHLRRAAALHCKLAAASDKGRLIETAIDRLSFGLLIVAASGKILAANRVAQEILEAGDGLVVRNGELRACQDEDRECLARLLAGATAGCPDQLDRGGWTRISRRSEKAALTVMVAPLPERADLPSMRGDPAALILVSDPRRQRPVVLEQALRQAFGLTLAEARIAALIGLGMSPQDAARQLGITIGTARIQLKQVFSKLDVARQSELAVMISRIALLTPAAETFTSELLQMNSSIALIAPEIRTRH